MLVINPEKIVNQLEHQRRNWETQRQKTGTPTLAKIHKLGREIEGLANTFGLKVQSGGYYG